MHSDIKGYYRILGVPPHSPATEIKYAYRKLAKDIHPDRHPDDPAATAKFQAVNEAYACLSDRQARAQYDAVCKVADPPASSGIQSRPPAPSSSYTPPTAPPASHQAIDPVVCASCGAISAQPRYVIFSYVFSAFVVTMSKTIEGVFCPSCAPRQAILASAITWMFGWWGLPWGPIRTVSALYRNAMDGVQPAEENGELLGQQAIYFRDCGKPDLAAALVEQALAFEVSDALRERLLELKAALPPSDSQLVDRWTPLRRWAFWVQISPLLAIVALII
jgi:hypothetical protein